MTARRGFTLLEVMIAGAVGLVILTAALSFLVAVDRAHSRRTRLADMRRDAARVLDAMGDELRQAGLGVPTGSRLEAPGGTLASSTLVDATATSLGFLADLPRPDNTLNGFSLLADDQVTAMPPGGVALTNEQNGTCDVALGAITCRTGRATRLFATSGGGCHASSTHRTCPWGLNRYRANDWVLLADGQGRWVERQVAAGVSAATATRRTLVLTPNPPAALLATPAGGSLASVDRVFYRDNLAGVFERQQCWGTVGTGSLADLNTCAADTTGWENHLTLPPGSTVTFSYFDATGAALGVPVPAAQLGAVARVDIALHLQRLYGDELLVHDALLSVAFRQ
jgi:prepilin-type N-terminal cleavage/methylation domain-containing protein